MAIVKHYDITKAELDNLPLDPGSLYFCTDTMDLYYDSETSGRVSMAKDIVYVATENNKPLAPLTNRLYVVIETGTMYFYINEWVSIGTRPQIHFCNVTVENGSLTVSNSRISKYDTAEFVPDISVADLCSGISATCADGSVTVSLTSNYPIIGEIIVNN